MKTITYFIVQIFFLTTFLQAQVQLPGEPYAKIEYEGLNPIWYETCIDTTFKNSRMDGYNHFRPGDVSPMILNNKVYMTFNINESSDPFYGNYIQCRDLTTGELIWQYMLGVKESGHQEAVRLMNVDGSNRLNVISQIKKAIFDPNNNVYFYEDMILSKRIFDADSGELLFSYRRDFNDVDAYEMQFSTDKRAKYSYLIPENEYFRYIAPTKINDSFFLKSLLLDETGKKVGEESLLKFKLSTTYFNLIQISADTFIHVEINYADSTLLFRYISPDLKEYATYTTPKLKSRPEFLEFVKMSVDKKKILFEYLDRNDPFFNFVELLVFDTKANLLKRAALDNYSSNYFEVLKWEDDGDEAFTVLKQEIIKDENNNRISVLNVSIYDDQNGEYIINTFKSTEPTRYAVPFNNVLLNDDQYFIQFAEFRNASAFSRDFGAYAISQMLLDGNTLFLPSNTEDLTTVSSTIKAYPNPTTDEFTLDFDTEYTGTIQVYSMGGHLLLQKSVSHTRSEQIDMATLDAGMYMVQCIPSDHKISPVTLKLVRM
jgi:hypothetical protein